MSGLTPVTSATSTNASTVQCLRTDWQTHAAELRQVREKVFIEEQHVPESLEWDDFDDDAVHFLARDKDGNAIGCVRLLPSGQISRLCVLEQYRSHGVGRLLLDHAEQEARDSGMREVFLHAQTQACAFYEHAGFSVNGGIFLEADIPHRQMTKELRD